MLSFIVKRAISSLIVVWVIVTASFFIMRFAPGNPLQTEKGMTDEVRENLERKFDLHICSPKNLSVSGCGEAYFNQLEDIALRFDFGPSMFQRDKDVNEIIVEAAPYSFQLGLQALFVALILGIPAGLIAGLRQNTWVDYGAMTTAMAGVSIPNFVLGPILILIFSLWLGWFDPVGWDEWTDSVLPSITLGMYYAAYVARLTRGGMLEVVRQDWMRTARAKGLRERVIVARHALKGAILPVVSYLGPAFAGMLTGSVVVEKIFALPGLGEHFVQGAFNRDYSLVLGVIVLYSVILITLNLLVDIAYTILDPRVRLS